MNKSMNNRAEALAGKISLHLINGHRVYYSTRLREWVIDGTHYVPSLAAARKLCGLRPFESLEDIIEWWKANASSCTTGIGLLMDFTQIEQGLQRREIVLERGAWVLGFPQTQPIRRGEMQ